MTSANETQVGGTHYKTQMQHWDLAADLGLGYFEGQITKYVTRHRSKKGEEDMRKAMHFTDKLIEVAAAKRYVPRPGLVSRVFGGWLYPAPLRSPAVLLDLGLSWKYGQANKLDFYEVMAIQAVCNWRTLDDLRQLRDYVSLILADVYSVDL